MFQQMDSNWDLLCVLDLPNESCQVMSSDEKQTADAIAKGKPLPAKRTGHSQAPMQASTGELDDVSDALDTDEGSINAHENSDSLFYTHIVAGMNVNKFDECWLLTQFRDYVKGILDQALDLKTSFDGDGQGD